MELIGKAIIFKDEEEAKIWFKAITDATAYGQVLNGVMEIKEFKKRFETQE